MASITDNKSDDDLFERSLGAKNPGMNETLRGGLGMRICEEVSENRQP